MQLIYLPTDFHHGRCDRCGNSADVIPEIGPQAENVCSSCLQRAFEADYREYRLLLSHDRSPIAM